MVTRRPQQATPPTQAGNVTVTIPTNITLKDVVVIVTAIITIVSSWTFYTMRLSIQEAKVAEFNVKMEKISADLEAIRKDNQDVKFRLQALEIRQSMKR